MESSLRRQNHRETNQLGLDAVFHRQRWSVRIPKLLRKATDPLRGRALAPSIAARRQLHVKSLAIYISIFCFPLRVAVLHLCSGVQVRLQHACSQLEDEGSKVSPRQAWSCQPRVAAAAFNILICVVAYSGHGASQFLCASAPP